MAKGADEPKGLRRELTEAALIQELRAGKKASQIANEHGISRQAVYKRIKEAERRNSAALVAPEANRRFVAATLSEMDSLQVCLERAKLLQDACHEWLKDPDQPDRYDVGPRGGDVMVIHLRLNGDQEPTGKPIKRPLSDLLQELDTQVSVIGTETRYADPRKLILNTMRECRGLITDGLDLAERIQSIEAMEEFRTITLEAIGKVTPDVRAEIEQELQRRLSIRAAAAGFGQLEPAALTSREA